MKNTTFTWTDALLIILFIAVLYLILTRIFGHSASDLSILIGLFTLLFTNQYRLNREIGEVKMTMKHSFEKVKEDITAIRVKVKA